MDPGGGFGGAFGGGKAGGAQDPMSFVKRPAVIARICALVFAIFVFGTISSNGWHYDNDQGKEVCIFNESATACHFGTFVGVIAFVASIALLVGEWFFEQMSSIKTRKHYVIADAGFSAVWAAFYFLAFAYMSFCWSKTAFGFEFAQANALGSILFSLLSAFAWGGGSFLAYQRYKAGTSTAFSAGLGDEDGGCPEGTYTAYDEENGGQYSEPPFSDGGGAGTNYQQQVQY